MMFPVTSGWAWERPGSAGCINNEAPCGTGGFVLIAFVRYLVKLFLFLLNGGQLVKAEEQKKGGGESYGKHGTIPFDGLVGVCGGLPVSLVRRG
jgi:hypothetical protein